MGPRWRAKRHLECWRGGLAVFFVVWILGPLPGGLASTTSPLGGAGSVSTTALSAAESSLENGSGPAGGQPMACQGSGGGASVTCDTSSGSSSTGPAVPAASSDLPKARYGGTMAYDPVDGYVVLFSGSGDDATWTFAHGNWTELFPAVSPRGRTGSALVYDARDGYLVLFGGIGKTVPGVTYLSADYLNDTWTFLHGVWTNITTAVAPSPRYDEALTYDAQDGYVLLFGGDYQRSFLNDTWTFAGGRWTNVTASVGTAPSCRFDTSITDDPAEGYVLLFGGVGKRVAGCSGTELNVTLDQSWAFSGGKWRELSPVASPPAVWGASLAYDPADGYALLFGGILTTDLSMQTTWKYLDGNWSLVTPTTFPATSPPARCWGSLAYDAGDGYLLLFGGDSEPGQYDAVILGDTWAYRGGVWMNVFPPPSPSPRSGTVMTYDPKDGFVLLFGGEGSAGPLNDTWKYVDGSWLLLTPPVSPPARYGASMVYDVNPENASLSYVVLFGGIDANGGVLNDTWAFAKGEWSNITATSPNATNTPPARFGASMAYDGSALVQALVLFGGYGVGGYLNDTWLFVNGSWTADSLGGAPSPRADASLAYDATSGDGYLILFGGENSSTTFGDTWEFTGLEKWDLVPLAPSPPARFDAGLVYDVALGELLLFGGRNGSSVLADTWTYVHGTWSPVPIAPPPPGRYAFGAAYDVADSISLVFGGNGSLPSSGSPRGDLWGFTPKIWTNLSAVLIRLPTISGPASGSISLEDVAAIAAIAVAAIVVVILWVRRRDAPPRSVGTASPKPESTSTDDAPGEVGETDRPAR